MFLEVIGKYENNFHIINSIVSRIDLYDEILIKESNELAVSFKGQFGSLIENNNINLLFKEMLQGIILKQNDSHFIYYFLLITNAVYYQYTLIFFKR